MQKFCAHLRCRSDVNWAMISPPVRLGADGGFNEERKGKYHQRFTAASA
jgi:hypothetical protein